MSFGAMAWLWISAAAVIPVFIHLWSRKSGKPKMLPTFRFLPDKSIARASRIELHEKTLLLLRVLLILLISLLLAGLFFDGDPPQFSSVKISESDSAVTQTNENEDVLELQISPERIDRLGWFRLVEQVNYDYNPGLILVEGKLTANRLKGPVPKLAADMQWNPTNLPEQTYLGSWVGLNDTVYRYEIIRSESGTESSYTPADVVESDYPGFLKITIAKDATNAIKDGFRLSTSLWNVNQEEGVLSEGIIAVVQYGDTDFTLMETDVQKAASGYLSAGPEFGIRLPVILLDSLNAVRTSSRLNNLSDEGVLRFDSDEKIQLTADPEPAYGEWFYAGVANQLLKHAVRIDEIDVLEIDEIQVQPEIIEDAARAGWVEKESASLVLLFLILLVWAGERILSNRRGM
jgi:hypothetical protein